MEPEPTVDVIFKQVFKEEILVLGLHEAATCHEMHKSLTRYVVVRWLLRPDKCPEVFEFLLREPTLVINDALLVDFLPKYDNMRQV